jgi:hypothetical protein
MGVGYEAETDCALTKDHGIHIEGCIVDPIRFLHTLEGPEAGKIVRREQFDLLVALLGVYILNGQRVDTESRADGSNFFSGWIVHVEPPDSIEVSFGKAEKAPSIFARENQVTELSGVDSGFQGGGKEAESVRIRANLTYVSESLRCIFSLICQCFLLKPDIDEVSIRSHHRKAVWRGRSRPEAGEDTTSSLLRLSQSHQGLQTVKVDVESVF